MGFTLAIIALVAYVAVRLAKWSLAPLDKEKGLLKFQFSILDTYLLVGCLSIAGLLVFGSNSGAPAQLNYIILLVFSIGITGFWVVGVHQANSAQAKKPLIRSAIILFLVPIAYCVSFIGVGLTATFLEGLTETGSIGLFILLVCLGLCRVAAEVISDKEYC